MGGPYGFEQSENCQTRGIRAAGFFCQLAPAALKDFDAVRSVATYPAGAILFHRKQEPRGVFVLCEGKVKLSISSSAGKVLITSIAKPGEILGLSAVITGSPYEVTAETLHPCQVTFIHRHDFLRLLEKHLDMHQRVVRQLVAQYSNVCEQLRTVTLSASVQEKLARLLLEWSADSKRVNVPLTHEEIAELVGTSREAVTKP